MTKFTKQLQSALTRQIRDKTELQIITNQIKREMENKSTSPRSYKADDMTALVQKALAGSATTASMRQYVSGEENTPVDAYAIVSNATRNLTANLQSMSKNNKKRIYNALGKLEKGFTISRINRVLTTLGYSQKVESTTLKVSVKEQKIQSSRTNYVNALNALRTAKKAYKEEKGDFYKNPINHLS